MNAFQFYTGLHRAGHAEHFPFACLSVRWLHSRRKPIGGKILVDSGAFTELNLYGRYETTVEQHADTLHRLHTDGVCDIAGAVSQDYMCEPFMLERTGLTILEHQRLTVERYDALRTALEQRFAGDIPFPVLPVLQGFAVEDYLRHMDMYGDRLRVGMWVGVGSVCKRQGNVRVIEGLLSAIKRQRPDLRLHGFGVKSTALMSPIVRTLLHSADSMAWSFAARKQGRGRDANDWREAMRFTLKIAEQSVSDLV